MSTTSHNSQVPDDPETVARATLSLLEIRLRRLEFLLTGNVDLESTTLTDSDNANHHDQQQQQPISDDETNPSAQPEQHPVASLNYGSTILGKLDALQRDLNSLRRANTPGGKLVRDIEALHTTHPDLFPISSTTTPTPTTTTTVLTHAPRYPTTASRLSLLSTLPVPPPRHSAALVTLQPRLSAALARQQRLQTQAEELRDRSVRCLEWWVRHGVVGMGECWEDWEGRVRGLEREVGRVEARAE